MPPELTDLTDGTLLGGSAGIGIPIALIAAVFLSLGAQFQHGGVAKVEARHAELNGLRESTPGLTMSQLMA
ncbi:MAG TPA: multidrug DMT transporter permease, partial [Naasia sp.]